MLRTAALAVPLLACLGPAVAQKGKAETCPWCRNDPELMQRAGVIGHGPLPIARQTSVELARDLPATQWLFVETAHLRWASALPGFNIDLQDQARLAPELARLREALPAVPVKLRKVDPWLRLHLMAQRGEEFFARFQSLLQVTDADFPEQREADKPFMGAGRFLGERDKFEVVLHSTVSTHNLFTREFSGAQVAGALRWHFPGEHKLLVSVPCEDSDLRQDRWLHPHVVHNLSHLFFSAYKHFSYDPPLWLDEGLALAMEREIDPRSSTNEGEEGTYRDDRGPGEPQDAVRKLLAREKQKTLAVLLYVREVGELDKDALLTAWSMARFLIDEHPERLAQLLGGVKGQLDEKGYPTGDDLPGLQRRLLKELWGLTPQQFDELWREWAARPSAPVRERGR